MISLGTIGTAALVLPANGAYAQMSLPPVNVDAPQKRARPAVAPSPRRAGTTRAVRSNRAAHMPQAAPAAAGSGHGGCEQANGPVH